MHERITYRQHSKRLFAGTGGVHIKSGGFHLHAENAHFGPQHTAVRVVVEHIGRQNVAHFVIKRVLFALGSGFFKQFEVGNRAECSGKSKLGGVITVRAGAHRKYQVAHVQIFIEATARAHANYIFDVVEIEQLVRIDSYGRLSHARSHNGHSFIFIIAGVALNTAQIVDEHGLIQKIFGNEFCAQRITGHQYGLREIAFFCGDMRRWNRHFVPPFSIRI